MSLLVWKCRGLGNLPTEKELGDLTRAQDPSVLFIAETWTDEARLQKIKRNLQFDHMFFIPRVTLGGGFVLFLEGFYEFEGRNIIKKSYRLHH